MWRRSVISLLFTVLVTASLVACGRPPPAGARQSDVQVTLGDSRITASQTTFSPDVLYHFSVANQGTVTHELLIQRHGMEQQPTSGNGAMTYIATGNLSPGETRTFDFTFTTAMTQQDLEFGCYYQGHQDLRLSIQVK